MDLLDKQIIRIMQDEFPLVKEPYKEFAKKLNISEQELLNRLRIYKEEGKIRKMGAVLRHVEAGFRANALCAWVVPVDKLDEIAQKLAQCPSISHCYDRNTTPDWPYNIYTMIHAHTRQECEVIAEKLAKENNLQQYTMLYSVKEWKKQVCDILTKLKMNNFWKVI